MTRLEQVKDAIERLTFEERAELARWFHGWTDDEWDKQMAEDVAAGRLDNLLAEADRRIDADGLRNAPKRSAARRG